MISSICDCDSQRGPQKSLAMVETRQCNATFCDFRVTGCDGRSRLATAISSFGFRAETHSFCRSRPPRHQVFTQNHLLNRKAIEKKGGDRFSTSSFLHFTLKERGQLVPNSYHRH